MLERILKGIQNPRKSGEEIFYYLKLILAYIFQKARREVSLLSFDRVLKPQVQNVHQAVENSVKSIRLCLRDTENFLGILIRLLQSKNTSGPDIMYVQNELLPRIQKLSSFYGSCDENQFHSTVRENARELGLIYQAIGSRVVPIIQKNNVNEVTKVMTNMPLLVTEMFSNLKDYTIMSTMEIGSATASLEKSTNSAESKTSSSGGNFSKNSTEKTSSSSNNIFSSGDSKNTSSNSNNSQSFTFGGKQPSMDNAITSANVSPVLQNGNDNSVPVRTAPGVSAPTRIVFSPSSNPISNNDYSSGRSFSVSESNISLSEGLWSGMTTTVSNAWHLLTFSSFDGENGTKVNPLEKTLGDVQDNISKLREQSSKSFATGNGKGFLEATGDFLTSDAFRSTVAGILTSIAIVLLLRKAYRKVRDWLKEQYHRMFD